MSTCFSESHIRAKLMGYPVDMFFGQNRKDSPGKSKFYASESTVVTPLSFFTSKFFNMDAWHLQTIFQNGGFLRLKHVPRQYFWYNAIVATNKSLD